MKIPILIDQKFKLPSNFIGSKESHVRIFFYTFILSFLNITKNNYLFISFLYKKLKIVIFFKIIKPSYNIY